MTLKVACALTLLVFLYYLGTVISRVTKGRIPVALASVFLMLFAFWTFMPSDIVQTANIGTFAAFSSFCLMISVGSMFNLKDFKKDWRIVVLAFVIMALIGVVMLVVMVPIYGKDFVAAAYPVICGSLVATNVVIDGLKNVGLNEIAGLMALLLSIQGMVAAPILSYGTRLECKRLLALYRAGEIKDLPVKKLEDDTPKKKPLIDRLPGFLRTPELSLVMVLGYGTLAMFISQYTAPISKQILSYSLVAMLLGMLLRQFGLIQKNPIAVYGIEGFNLMMLLISVRSNLGNLTPATFIRGTLPVFLTVIIAIVVIFAVSIPMGKLFGYGPGLCIGAGTGIFLGYPLNYMTMSEVISHMAKTPEEEEFLKDAIIPKVMVGALSSTSTVSVIIAGVVVGLFFS